ncbi:LysM peptidoglycan-binding domain-containing protein [Microbacterium indicum]|uniref:LysM peptidoglycan-binding domain-containing protein n=1 Tax=Microbacterium indicum TaxID=358100 RepID=UPI0003F8881A|nr:LysM peptidoglycan-binding domain-containing protein [Microbacterium indicum]
MSTIALAAPAPQRTRLRLTVRGRRVLAGLAALPLAAGAFVAILGGGSALGSGEQGAGAGSFETVTAQAGDSLWSIAERVAPEADPRDVVDSITSLNQLGGSGIEAGQSIAIPTAYSAG